MIVPVSTKNEKEWIELCIALWPDTTAQDLIEGRAAYKLSDFLYYIDDEAVAFISLSVRHEYVEGTETPPVGYLEGIYVKPAFRKRAIARELVSYAKEWAFSQGCNEMASDVELHNEDSQLFHEKIGFAEANRVVCYSMNLLRKKEQQLGMDAKSSEFKAAMSAVRERIAVVKRRERRDGYIDYYGCRNICHEFQGILEEIHKAVVRGHYVYAYSVAVLVQINLAKLANTADDSAGGITDTRSYVDELLEKVCEAVKYESPDARYIFLQSAKDSGNKAFDGWTEFAYNILKKTARLAEEDTEQKMYAALDELLAKSKDSYSRWYLEHDALVRLEIIKATHGEIDAETFIEENIQYSGIRKIAIQNAIGKDDFGLAEKLCLEKVANEAARHEWSRPCEWRYLLYEIYDKEGNVQKKIETARDLLFGFDLKYYAVLKELLIGQDLWEQEYDGLLSGLSNSLPQHMYMDILSKENEVAKLLDEVRKHPASVFTYGKQLSGEFLQEVCDICAHEIYQQANEAKDRKKYKKVCGNIKSLFDYGGVSEAEAIVADLTEKFLRRAAFVDELKSLSQKFIKTKAKTRKNE